MIHDILNMGLLIVALSDIVKMVLFFYLVVNSQAHFFFTCLMSIGNQYMKYILFHMRTNGQPKV